MSQLMVEVFSGETNLKLAHYMNLAAKQPVSEESENTEHTDALIVEEESNPSVPTVTLSMEDDVVELLQRIETDEAFAKELQSKHIDQISLMVEKRIVEHLGEMNWGMSDFVTNLDVVTKLSTVWKKASYLCCSGSHGGKFRGVDPALCLVTSTQIQTLRRLFDPLNGEVATSALDKPNWLFLYCREMFATQMTFLSEYVLKFSHPDHHVITTFADQFIEEVSTLLTLRFQALGELSDSDQLFADTLTELIEFEEFFPSALRCQRRLIQVITNNAEWLRRWVRCDSAYVQAIVTQTLNKHQNNVMNCTRHLLHLAVAVASRFECAAPFLTAPVIKNIWEITAVQALRHIEELCEQAIASENNAASLVDLINVSGFVTDKLPMLSDRFPFILLPSSNEIQLNERFEVLHNNLMRRLLAITTTREFMEQHLEDYFFNIISRVESRKRTESQILNGLDLELYKLVFGSALSSAKSILGSDMIKLPSSRVLMAPRLPMCRSALTVLALESDHMKRLLEEDDDGPWRKDTPSPSGDGLLNESIRSALSKKQVMSLCRNVLGLL
eukprot:PhF_6_TR5554/c0_g1_i1/m.7928